MTKWFWKNRRFGWPLVAAVVFVTISLLAADYIWRVTVMPVDTFALYAIAVDLVAAAIAILLYRMLRKPVSNAK